MASKTPSFNLLFIAAVGAVAILARTMMAQSGSSGCSNVIVTLQPCLNYITRTSESPSSSCCTSFGNVVKTQAQCLCDVISGNATASLGLKINQTQALTLPGACRITTPSASLCNVSIAAESPTGTPPPSSGGSSSNRNPTKITNPALSLVLLFVVSLIAILGSK